MRVCAPVCNAALTATAVTSLNAIVDIVELCLLHWRDAEGQTLERVPLLEPSGDALTAAARDVVAMTADHGVLLQRCQAARTALIECVAEAAAGDDDAALADACFVELGGGERVGADALRQAVRRQLLARRESPLLPLFCGSALKNRGIQPLLDGVIDYLPAPGERFADQAALGTPNDPLCALAFKVVHDTQRGLLVWLRVLSGTLRSGQRLINVNEQQRGSGAATSSRQRRRDTPGAERALRLVRLDADDELELDHVAAGDICAVVGLKNTATGDTLVDSGEKTSRTPLDGVTEHPPVFFCAIDAQNAGDQAALDEALHHVRMEDPRFGRGTVVCVRRDFSLCFLVLDWCTRWTPAKPCCQAWARCTWKLSRIAC